MDEMNYAYDRRFEGNILIVGRTGCGKTTFVQSLGRSKSFGDIDKVFWVSEVELSKDREDNIRDCFVDQTVDFFYRNNVADFNDLLEIFAQKKANYDENDLGEKLILDKVNVTDDVSGLADKSDKFANLLTVSRKYGLTCMYVFHTI